MSRRGALSRLAVALLLGAAASTGWAAEGDLAAAPPGASSCSGCHAIRGKTAVPPIRGRPVDEIAAAMDAFRTGARPATIMNRIAPGFSPAETIAIAAWLSRQAVR